MASAAVLHKLKTRLSLLVISGLVLGASAAEAQRVYKWVDDAGVVQYGDRVPPEYADRDRTVLNSQGIPVDRQQGALTPEELAERELQAKLEADAQAQRAETARRDRMLLETYLSVEDIEDLRDRRLELLESQITVTQIYLENIRERLQRLHRDAARYSPYSDKADAPELPGDLAGEIESTLASIRTYEESIDRTREEQADLTAQFDSDIERFRELKEL